MIEFLEILFSHSHLSLSLSLSLSLPRSLKVMLVPLWVKYICEILFVLLFNYFINSVILLKLLFVVVEVILVEPLIGFPDHPVKMPFLYITTSLLKCKA